LGLRRCAQRAQHAMSEGVVLSLGQGVHVSVDFWRHYRVPVAAHFLTHMHADHTEGLGNAWRSGGGAIFCAPATELLLQVHRPAFLPFVLPLTAAGSSGCRYPPWPGPLWCRKQSHHQTGRRRAGPNSRRPAGQLITRCNTGQVAGAVSAGGGAGGRRDAPAAAGDAILN